MDRESSTTAVTHAGPMQGGPLGAPWDDEPVDPRLSVASFHASSATRRRFLWVGVGLGLLASVITLLHVPFAGAFLLGASLVVMTFSLGLRTEKDGCSFCGAERVESHVLVAGPSAAICSECIEVSAIVVASQGGSRSPALGCAFCAAPPGTVEMMAGPSISICVSCLARGAHTLAGFGARDGERARA